MTLEAVADLESLLTTNKHHCISSAFAYLFFSSKSPSSSSTTIASSATSSASPSTSPSPTPSPSESHARPLTKLNRPKVILNSSDGFRFRVGVPLQVPTAAILRRADVYFIQSQERYYNSSVPFEDRVDAILSYVDLPSDEIPDFMTLYLEDPDHQGHKVGADDPQITEADSRIDKMIGWLFSGLEQRGIFYDVTIIMVGDHGMVTTCDKKQIFSNDLAPWINVLDNWVISHTPLLAIMPPSGYSPLDVVAKMNQGLSFGKFENGKHLKVYLKKDLPSRLHYLASDRIPPIIG
ncbi:hypothetical protein AHAS_Ahas13G0315500 [Arachis hypogaea]